MKLENAIFAYYQLSLQLFYTLDLCLDLPSVCLIFENVLTFQSEV
jgi:hypothetical protein